MLNMNQYNEPRAGSLFSYGINVEGFQVALNRYTSGDVRGKLTIGSILSAGTGHWPFTLFDVSFLTGPLGCWQFTLLGWTVGMKKVHDIDQETGQIVGKDKKMLYSFFSCFNHKGKQLEEIIKPTI